MKGKPGVDQTSVLQRLVRRHYLDRIELVCPGARVSAVIARAYPSRHGPLVERRYQAALVGAGKTDFTFGELGALREKAVETPIAHARGHTIADAVAALTIALDAVAAEGKDDTNG